MNNEVLQKILAKKEITITDKIIFRTIFDVLSALFTDENHISSLKSGYKINDQQQIWFPNITPDHQKELNIKKGYANYMSKNWDYIYQFDGTKDIEKRKKLGKKLIEDKIQLITFAKLNEKAKGIGYHFVGVFAFNGYLEDDCKTMIYKKISDSFYLF
ncbi:hypothetical protein [Spiroplasma platyhelix]|uniref:PvuRts1 I-like SET and RING associated domain-containing protein n=1 Tax=Spiroplasma platyhelix PALS-1 TaxID=1276218 RepID=A0A846TW33_9MOLU|nr:hypothetical protein [Spiroplasma platyhelix]MBE4704000.1 hypothetical protein [Spiroplasma platyhelix PALS-1]NKE38372.1 hypothetical protein [Spiroplasma platyhelix PALS-1]UJB29258.1 hypothetical protein SPLAT_v1c04940 [Spiroplasma platyhelix PALS-1]